MKPSFDGWMDVSRGVLGTTGGVVFIEIGVCSSRPIFDELVMPLVSDGLYTHDSGCELCPLIFVCMNRLCLFSCGLIVNGSIKEERRKLLSISTSGSVIVGVSKRSGNGLA